MRFPDMSVIIPCCIEHLKLRTVITMIRRVGVSNASESVTTARQEFSVGPFYADPEMTADRSPW